MCMLAAIFYVFVVMNYQIMRFVTGTEDETKSDEYKRKMNYVRFFAGIFYLIVLAVFNYEIYIWYHVILCF
jgi:heme/copper-type cytochrome/quinol oxidase subunit 2